MEAAEIETTATKTITGVVGMNPETTTGLLEDQGISMMPIATGLDLSHLGLMSRMISRDTGAAGDTTRERENEMVEIETGIDRETGSMTLETEGEKGQGLTAMSESEEEIETEITEGDTGIDNAQPLRREAHKRTEDQRRRDSPSQRVRDSGSTHLPKRKTNSKHLWLLLLKLARLLDL